MKYFQVFCISILIHLCAIGQPTDNPYKTRYGGVGHWTDSLNWTIVSDVTTFGAIANDNNDDSSAIQSAINQAHANGGGVVFFPAGTYNVSGYIKLKTGVILRGENPTGIVKATEENYRPPSKLIFPRFILDTTANNGAGNDRKKAFKSISGEYECSNSGIINLDINRAYIAFQPTYKTSLTPPNASPTPIQKNRNIIVMGCRTNNAVIPDGNIPVLGNPAGSKQRAWQIFPWRFSTNIEVFVYQNSVIANNRLNDGQSENFEMPNFRLVRRNTQTWFPLGQRTIGTGWKAEFDYNAHYGISLNRGKIYQDTNGLHRIHFVSTYGTPETEPDLFRTGFEIRDNWIYKTSRVGIIAAGLGLVIKGNIMMDNPLKVLPAYENFTGPTGNVTPQGATTFENRGIDFSGWQVLVDSNQLEAYSNYVFGYLSTDGEGILIQECCGGTQVNDYTISNNICKNWIDIFNMRDINNVTIKNNNINGSVLYIVANTNEKAYYLNNLLIENNINVGSIQAIGTRGGFAGKIRNNQGPGGSMNISCHIVFESNNSGFGTVTYRAVDPNNLTNHTAPIVQGNCAESTIYPLVEIIQPVTDTTYEDNLTQYILKAKLTRGDIFTSKIDFLQGTNVVSENLTVNPADSTATYVWNVPANATNITAFTARVRDADFVSFSRVKKFTRVTPVLSVNGKSTNNIGVLVYPNPVCAGSNLTIRLTNAHFPASISLFDIAGKKMNVNFGKGESKDFALSNRSELKSGIYLIKVETTHGSKMTRLVVQ